MNTKLSYNKMDGRLAFHAVQSFKPGEVTPEEWVALQEQSDNFGYGAPKVYAKYNQYKDSLIGQINSLNGQSTDYTLDELNELAGTIIYDKQTSKYYKVSINKQKHSVKDLSIDPASKIATEYWTPMVQLDKIVGDPGTDSYKVDYDYYAYSIYINYNCITFT